MTPRLRLLAAAAVFSLGSTAWAGPPPAADPCAGRSQASCHAPGVVDKPAIKVARGGISAAEGQQLTDRAKKMLEVVMQAPLLKPEGMSLHPTITVEGPPAHAVKHHPALVRTTLLAKPIKLEDKSSSQDKKTGAWMGTGEGPILRLNANDLGVFLSNDTLDLSKPAQFFSAPRQVGEVQGFPVYAVGGNEVLMISKGNTLPWRPFPVESYFQMLISQEQETQDLFKKQLSSTKGPDRAELEEDARRAPGHHRQPEAAARPALARPASGGSLPERQAQARRPHGVGSHLPAQCHAPDGGQPGHLRPPVAEGLVAVHDHQHHVGRAAEG
ncbi:hypothetical protein ACN28E_42725 [Archangium lansingense]|uniref:hypothetical protein n=1 Tax=Archangium lansingense TaxID=2995310 RepID=UPI003B75E651